MDAYRRKAILALMLLVPAPSLGVLVAMILLPDTSVGKGFFVLMKVWLFAFPVMWLKWVDKGRFSLSPMRKGGWLVGVLSGLAISVIILSCFWLFGEDLLNRDLFVEKMTRVGLAMKMAYFGCAAYWILVNSVLEEYVWRWFCVAKAEVVLPRWWAIIAAALAFTLHHVLALSVFLEWPAVLLFSFGVFVGGVTWSYMYAKYRSIWPGYISHAIVDLCIFAIGASLLFGATP